MRDRIIFLFVLLFLCVDGWGCNPVSNRESFCEDHVCEGVATFSPAPELEAYTSAGLKRLGRATGVSLEETDTGIPVFFEEDLEFNGHVDCGQTLIQGFAPDAMFAQSIKIDPTPPDGCPPIHITLLHEMIHALAPTVEHAPSGLFAEFGGGSKIDAPALVQLCSTFDCQEVVPE